MTIVQDEEGYWIIIHAGKEIDQRFSSEDAAWSWADRHIDDQVFDEPNSFSPPLTYRNIQ